MARITGYGTVRFGILREPDTGIVPDFASQALMVSRHVPGRNRSVTQDLGMGPSTVTYPLWLDTRQDYAALMALQGATLRTLTLVERVTSHPEGTTNYLANPSAEIDLANIIGATARDSAYAYAGAWSVKAVTDGAAANQGPYYQSPTGLALTGARTFVGSVYARGAGTVYVRIQFAYTDGSLSNRPTTTATLGDAWTRIITSATTSDGAKTLDRLVLVIRTSTAQAVTFYTDAAQIEEKPSATSYTDGSLGPGYRWLGTAHNSASVREGGSKRIVNGVTYMDIPNVMLTNVGPPSVRIGGAVQCEATFELAA
jgi:hypothetical protein